MIAKVKRGRGAAPKENRRNVHYTGFALTFQEAVLFEHYREKLNYTIGDFIRHALNDLQEQEKEPQTNDTSDSEKEADLAQA